MDAVAETTETHTVDPLEGEAAQEAEAETQAAALVHAEMANVQPASEGGVLQIRDKAEAGVIRAAVYVLRVSKCWLLALLEGSCETDTKAQEAGQAVLQELCRSYGGRDKKGQAPRGVLDRHLGKLLSQAKGGKTQAECKNEVHNVPLGKSKS